MSRIKDDEDTLKERILKVYRDNVYIPYCVVKGKTMLTQTGFKIYSETKHNETGH